MKERAVLHLNVADFSVAVERVVNTDLKHKPVIIAPVGANRAVVHDMSDEAYKDGVRKGMLLRQALRRSRSAHVLPPRFDLYRKAMFSFIKEAKAFTPHIEYGTDDGHLYLDITGTHRLFGPAPDVGLKLQRNVKDQLRINPIWTYASNKLVAKVASRLVKPVGEYIVAPGEESAFLAPLPLTILPGLKQQERESLREFNLNYIGDVAGLSREQLAVAFGKRSLAIHHLCQGIDGAQVSSDTCKKKKLTISYTFTEDTNEKPLIESVVTYLTSQLALQLRKEKQTVRRVGIWLSYSDGTSCVRNATGRKATAQDYTLNELALLALSRAWSKRIRIRSLQVTLDLFQTSSGQMLLFEPSVEKQEQTALTDALDTIRQRFGDMSIISGKQCRYKAQLGGK